MVKQRCGGFAVPMLGERKRHFQDDSVEPRGLSLVYHDLVDSNHGIHSYS